MPFFGLINNGTVAWMSMRQKYGHVALDNVSKENELKGRCTHEWYLSLSTLKSFNTQVFHHHPSFIRRLN
jgi:hypothetical protein